jgi:hypothetical protein
MNADTLEVSFYEAATGKPAGSVNAHLDSKRGPVYSLSISPPDGEKPAIRVGRFAFEYGIQK